MMQDRDPALSAAIQALIEAMQRRDVPAVAQQVNGLAPSERSKVLTPALEHLAEVDPASAQWFVRYLMDPRAKAQLQEGILKAAQEYLQEAGFVEGTDYEIKGGVLSISRKALPYAAPDDDPFGQLLLAECCELRD
ncbi:hypothetical protein JX360_03905 [Synechococcus bigranulatus str. 'Rupite']|uniref:Uncharacterized protein n=1 Tax=Thermostichus vulcanus str. 'Rupite' TaxID=2813851 RepID=A0ABT0C8C9_THEVL|nr:hypothetical protein [Thermostichus vulcanus str. 'Rupite']